MTIIGETSGNRRLPEPPPPRARQAATYRGERRRQARERNLIWRALPHLLARGGSCVVVLPPW